MDINQLEVLVAVAREKSFSRAAETLHRTQPAVSQAIRHRIFQTKRSGDSSRAGCDG